WRRCCATASASPAAASALSFPAAMPTWTPCPACCSPDPLPGSTRMSSSEEKIEWSGTPSQAQNLGWWLGIVTIPYAIWRWIVVRNTVLTLTTQRLKVRRGVFNRVTEDLELYRVRDTRLEQPFWQRLFGCGEVVLFT